MSTSAEGEVLVEHVSPRGPIATAVRGTLIAGALQGLREHGVFEPLLVELPPHTREVLLQASAMSWVPSEALLALCLAVDRLMLTDRQIANIGGSAAGSIGTTVLSALLRTAGATPWTLLSGLDRLWDRFYHGGGVTVLRLGPKDAHIELSGLPHAVSRYARASTHAFFQALAGKLTKSSYVVAARARTPAPTTFAFSLRWV